MYTAEATGRAQVARRGAGIVRAHAALPRDPSPLSAFIIRSIQKSSPSMHLKARCTLTRTATQR